MGYRDLLGKRQPRQQLTEDGFIPHVEPPLTYARVRSEASLVIASPDEPHINKGMASVILALLDDRLRRG